jgi:hypothetical protein
MAHISCSLFPRFIVEKVIAPPYEEAKNQLNYAFFQSKVQEGEPGIEGPSLFGRVVHLALGLALMIPLVNWAIYIGMQFFGFTLSQEFERAVVAGDGQSVEFLVQLGVNPNTLIAEEKPLVILAAEEDKFDIVKILLRCGADPNAAFERTPLIHILAQKGQYQLVRDALTLYEGDSALLDARGRTILEVLYDQEYDAFLTFINEGVVHPNLKNAQGDTILHHILLSGGVNPKAEDHGIEGIVALSEKDVDLNVRSGSTGKTPLWMAYQKFGVQGALAFMNYGADPNAIGDERDPQYSRVFESAWDLRYISPGMMDHVDPRLFWIAALKQGANANGMEASAEGVYERVRDLDVMTLNALYTVPDNVDRRAFLEGCRLKLLKTMDDAGWGTFSKAYQDGAELLWVGLLELGVRPPPGIDCDAIMRRVLENGVLQGDLERRRKILLTMQENGWEVVRIAYERNRNDDLFMLLENGAVPPRDGTHVLDIFRRVVLQVDRRTAIVKKMIDKGWNFQTFCDEVVRRNEYPHIRFALEMGREVPTVNWRSVLGIEHCRKTLLPGLDHLVPTGYGYGSEQAFLDQLMRNINEHNAKNVDKVNPLEILLFIHSQEGIERVMRTSSFEGFSDLLTDVVLRYPRINVEWFWNDLFEIPPSHYANFATVRGGADELPELPYKVSIETLYDFFDRINFNHPDQPHYKDRNARMDNGCERSPSALKTGMGSIIRRTKHNLPDAVAPHDALARRAYYDDHQKHLETVAYYLQLKWDEKGRPIPDPQHPGQFLMEDPHSTEPLNGIKASVLIDLGRTGQACSGRWKEIFYQCRCRLSGETEKNLTFVEQIRTLWGNHRAILMERLHHQETHTRDNVMYHLKEARGIPGDRPVNLDNYGDYRNRGDGPRVIQAFDALGYNPRDVIRMFHEHMLQNNQDGGDFRELMLSWMQDNLAQAAVLPCGDGKNLSQMRAFFRVRGMEKQRLPYTEVEQLMREYDKEFVLAKRHFPSVASFLSQLQGDPLLKPLWNILTLPDSDGVSRDLAAPLEEAEKNYQDLLRKCLDPSDHVAFNQCIEKRNQARKALERAEGTLGERVPIERLKELLGEARLEEAQAQELARIIQEHGLQAYAACFKEYQQVDQQEYNVWIFKIRSEIQALKSPEAVLKRFWPAGDFQEVERLQQAIREAGEALEAEDFDEPIRKALAGQLEALARYEKLKSDADLYIIDDEGERELQALREQHAPAYQRLKGEVAGAERALKEYLQPYYTVIGKEIPPRQNGIRFLLDIVNPLTQTIQGLRRGDMTEREIRETFLAHGYQIQIQRDQTLGQFLGSPEFGALRNTLGEAFILRALDGSDALMHERLSNPRVKQLLAHFFAEMVFSVSPSPMSFYMSGFHKDRFIRLARPQKRDEVGDVFEQTRGFNPLVLYQMMVELGELRYKNRGIFQGAFEALPPQEVEAEEGALPGQERHPVQGDQGLDYYGYAQVAAAILGMVITYKYILPKITNWWKRKPVTPPVDVGPLLDIAISSVRA